MTKERLAYQFHLGDQVYFGSVVDIDETAEKEDTHSLKTAAICTALGLTVKESEKLAKYGLQADGQNISTDNVKFDWCRLYTPYTGGMQ